jgi:hypothetical protein
MCRKLVKYVPEICEDCNRLHETCGQCTVYHEVPIYYIHQGACPFNHLVRITVEKKRVGQQKQKTKGNMA